jgi:uncharacterized membrane protein YfcA
VTVALLAIGALAAACVQATTGIGFALVLSPILFAVLTPAGVIVAVTALGLELNLLVLLAERRRPRVAWPELVPILLASVPGSMCGVLLLRTLPKAALQVAVGVALIVAAGLLLRRRAARRDLPRSGGLGGRLAIGFGTGALATSTGVSGPPLALWLARTRLSPGEVRDSLSASFLVLGAIAFATLVPVLHRADLSAGELAAGLTCVLVGHAVGSRAFARLDPEWFQPLLLVVIGGAGVASIAAGVSALY